MLFLVGFVLAGVFLFVPADEHEEIPFTRDQVNIIAPAPRYSGGGGAPNDWKLL